MYQISLLEIILLPLPLGQQEEPAGPEELLEEVPLGEVLLEAVALQVVLLKAVPAGEDLLEVVLEVAAEWGGVPYQEEYHRQGRLFRNLKGNLEVRKGCQIRAVAEHP
jgi:hypothetical protein